MKVIHMGNTQLLPPRPEACQECAVIHGPDEPHNQQSLYYQMKFKLAHGREATWADAMAHCSAPVRAAWTVELAKYGIKV